MNKFKLSSSILLLLITTLHLYLTPYSKVEESFNLQATHDLYYHGISPLFQHFINKNFNIGSSSGSSIEANNRIIHKIKIQENEQVLKEYYDHLSYPGVVPRSFLGAYIVSNICYGVRLFVQATTGYDINTNPKVVEFICRFILLLFNLHAYIRLGNAAERRLQNDTQMNNLKSTKRLSVIQLSNVKPNDEEIIKSSFSKTNLRQRHTNTISKSRNQSIRLKSSIAPNHESKATLASYFLLITCCQFHLPYYSSRMLPNIFALVLITHAYSFWFQREYYKCLSILTISMIIFRCDALLLLGSITLCMLFLRQVKIVQTIKVGILSTIVALSMSVPLDSLVWNKFIWPEGQVFFFNAIENKSSEWGVQPFHWYFTKALPKAMLFTIFLIIPSFLRIVEFCYGIIIQLQSSKIKDISIKSLPPLVDITILPFLIPILLFIDIYSFLPHKEVRFIFMALPMLNVIAAYGVCHLHNLAFSNDDALHKPGRFVTRGMYFIGIGVIGLSFCASMIFLWISHYNYPGGEAMHILQTQMQQRCDLLQSDTHQFFKHKQDVSIVPISVYVDVASAMTGVSRFNQHSASLTTCTSSKTTFEWKFSKEGFEDENVVFSKENNLEFTHLLTEDRSLYDGYSVIGVARGNPRITLKGIDFIQLDDAIYIMERDDYRTLFY